MRLVFDAWRRFHAQKDERVTRRFLDGVAEKAEDEFRRGMRSAKSGRFYRRSSDGGYRASAPGEFPARPSGRLYRSIRSRVAGNEAVVGTTPFYAKFLRDGTRKMARRKMSDDAMKEAIPKARPLLKRWIRWQRG